MLRYSALFTGLFYGFYHQSSLSAQAKEAEIDREYKRKLSLIDQAKAAYAKKDCPEPESSGKFRSHRNRGCRDQAHPFAKTFSYHRSQ